MIVTGVKITLNIKKKIFLMVHVYFKQNEDILNKVRVIHDWAFIEHVQYYKKNQNVLKFTFVQYVYVIFNIY